MPHILKFDGRFPEIKHGPERLHCPCCGSVFRQSGCVHGPCCVCVLDYCLACHKCDKHCDCEGGSVKDFDKARAIWLAKAEQGTS